MIEKEEEEEAISGNIMSPAPPEHYLYNYKRNGILMIKEINSIAKVLGVKPEDL